MRWAWALALDKTGNKSAARMPMIATTTSNSISVKAHDWRFFGRQLRRRSGSDWGTKTLSIHKLPMSLTACCGNCHRVNTPYRVGKTPHLQSKDFFVRMKDRGTFLSALPGRPEHH